MTATTQEPAVITNIDDLHALDTALHTLLAHLDKCKHNGELPDTLQAMYDRTVRWIERIADARSVTVTPL